MAQHRRHRPPRRRHAGGRADHGRLGDRRRPRSRSRRRRRSTSRPRRSRSIGSLLMSVGAASVLAMYSYGGYNQVCNIGDEIKDPARTIPRSIVLSTFLVAALYMLMTIVILGMIPWQEVQRIAHHRVGVHRADVLGSGDRPHRRHRDDRADPVRRRGVALRDDPRLLAHSVRRRPRRRLLQGLRARASDEAVSRRLARSRSRSSRSRSASSRSVSW